MARESGERYRHCHSHWITWAFVQVHCAARPAECHACHKYMHNSIWLNLNVRCRKEPQITYTIKFVNFTLAAPFQKNLGRWRGRGCASAPRSMVATTMLCIEVPSLKSSQEETYSRVVLYCIHAKDSGFKFVKVWSLNTDIFLHCCITQIFCRELQF